MTRDVESIVSTFPDDPVLLEALDEVISLYDIGFQQGYEDGLANKPVRNHPTAVPELFQILYGKGHEAGLRERDDRKVCKEVARWERRLGLCREEHEVRVVPREEVNQLERQEIFPEKKNFIQRYGLAIATMVGTGIVCGIGGFWVGKAQEQKRCMSVRREMGVDE